MSAELLADAVINTVEPGVKPQVSTMTFNLDVATGIGLLLAVTATLAVITAVRQLDLQKVRNFLTTPVGMATSIVGSVTVAGTYHQFGNHLAGSVSNNPWVFGGTVISAGMGGLYLIPGVVAAAAAEVAAEAQQEAN